MVGDTHVPLAQADTVTFGVAGLGELTTTFVSIRASGVLGSARKIG